MLLEHFQHRLLCWGYSHTIFLNETLAKRKALGKSGAFICCTTL
jgi:hypothetical protein